MARLVSTVKAWAKAWAKARLHWPGVRTAVRLLVRDDWRRNLLFLGSDLHRKARTPLSFPQAVRVNVTGLCNMRCDFCEIHYFYDHARRVAGGLHRNDLDVDQLRQWPWLRYIHRFSLETSCGEPFLNPNVPAMIRYLRALSPRIVLTTTTNGTLLGPDINETLVQQRFNHLSISLHAGTAAVYRDLLKGDFERILENIRDLVRRRREHGVSFPMVSLNFNINRYNASSISDFLKLAKALGVDHVLLYHYYNARNRLTGAASFLDNPAEANRIMRESYDLARKLGVRTVPENPPVVRGLQEGRDSGDDGAVCEQPWRNVQFPACLEEEQTHFFGVCNRINLFKIRLDQSPHPFDLRQLWRHPILQYLRKTVNAERRNPICRFCRNRGTPALRCVDTEEYSRQRDRAIRSYFDEARRVVGRTPDLAGIKVLDRNPYEYDPDEWPLTR